MIHTVDLLVTIKVLISRPGGRSYRM